MRLSVQANGQANFFIFEKKKKNYDKSRDYAHKNVWAKHRKKNHHTQKHNSVNFLSLIFIFDKKTQTHINATLRQFEQND